MWYNSNINIQFYYIYIGSHDANMQYVLILPMQLIGNWHGQAFQNYHVLFPPENLTTNSS